MKPSRAIVDRINALLAFPGGRRLVGAFIGRAIPYTGTIKPIILSVGDGRAEVAMDDRRLVRNHLRSIHALALANLGELTANLAMTSLQPEGTRWIVTHLSIDYVKKARGRVTATAHAPEVDWTVDGEHGIEAVIRDSVGDVVTRVRATIKSSPVAGPAAA